MFLSFAMSFGLLSISDSFSIAFFGQQFSRVGIILSLLSLTLPITSFANVIRTQYLIPQEKDKVYIKSVLFGAIANLILNIILIPIWSGVGACCSTIIAEFIVMAYQAVSVKKYLPIKQYIHETSTFFLKAVIMLAIIYPINWLNLNSIVRIIAQVAIGTLVYGVLNYRYVISILGNRQIKHIFKK
jgi:O-antigen/teichoic acid export membrane protein